MVQSHQRVWLRREEEEADSVSWDVRSDGGELLGTLKLSTKASIQEARGDTLWTTETDGLDIPYVVRYRIERF